MPRKGRGGSREGQVGKAYGNRVDLNGGSATPGDVDIRPYGGGEPSLPSPPTATSGPSAAGAAQAPAAVPPPGPLPGSLTALDAPSERPDEPITAGLPMGAGPGPEALGMRPGGPTLDMTQLARYLPALEHMQSMPGISRKTRNLIRLLRAAVPPEARMAGRPRTTQE